MKAGLVFAMYVVAPPLGSSLSGTVTVSSAVQGNPRVSNVRLICTEVGVAPLPEQELAHDQQGTVS